MTLLIFIISQATFLPLAETQPEGETLIAAVVGGATGSAIARTATQSYLAGAFQVHYANGSDGQTSYRLRLPLQYLDLHLSGTPANPSVIGYEVWAVNWRDKRPRVEFRPIKPKAQKAIAS